MEENEIKIGDQTWTSKNLDVGTYRNGEVIPQDGKYKGMNFSEVFLEMQSKFTPIDYSNSSITGSINRL
jgi:hypothetical protein